MIDSRRVAEFIAEQLERQDVADRLAKLVCVHVIKGNRLGDEIRIINVPDDQPGEDWLETTARKLVESAQEEALTLGAGIQRYAIQAWFGKEDKSRARIVITCRGTDDDDESIGTEGPDENGLVAQSMRHTEFFAQLGFRDRAAWVKDLQEEITKLRRENEALRSEQLRTFGKIREIYLADAERTADDRRQRNRDRLIENSVEKLETFGMHALNHWSLKKTGKPMFPEVAAAMVEAKTFADSLTDADIAKLQQTLGVDRTAHLIQFAQAVSKMKADDEGAGPGTALEPKAPNGVAAR